MIKLMWAFCLMAAVSKSNKTVWILLDDGPRRPCSMANQIRVGSTHDPTPVRGCFASDDRFRVGLTHTPSHASKIWAHDLFCGCLQLGE